MGVMVVAECGWREFGGFRETRGDAGQPITGFTDFADFTDYSKFGSRGFGKKCEIGKIGKLRDGAFSIVSDFSDGAGSARRESRGNRGVGDTNKYRDGPRAILKIFADFAEFARPTIADSRETSNLGDGLPSILTLPRCAPNTGDPNLVETVTSAKVLGDRAQTSRISRILPNSGSAHLAESAKSVNMLDNPSRILPTS